MKVTRTYIQAAFALTGILAGFNFSATAQSGPGLTGPGLNFQVDYMPASKYIRPEDSVKTGSTSVIRRIFMGSAFQLSKKIDTATGKARIWTLGLGGSYMKWTNKNYEKSVMPEELLGASIGLQHVRSLRNKWSVMGVLTAGVFTDLETIDGNDLFFNGGLIFIKQPNPRFSYGFGAMLTNTFGAPMLLPAFLISWKTTGKFDLQVSIPEGISGSYKVNSFLKTGLALRLNGSSYDVEKRPTNQRLMAYKEVTVGWENSFKVTKLVSFNIAGGSALLRSVDYREKRLADIFKTKPEHKLATSWFANAGISVHFKQ